MAKSANQKLKLLYLLRILSQETDENHALSTSELIQRLEAFDIHAERKSIYSDMESLNVLGYDIMNDRKKEHNGFYMASREFELPELKLLVDAVQSSRFITEKKSGELIHKLESLCSKYDAGRLQREVFVSDRIKAENEAIYYSIDVIHEAISANRQISFQYYEWDADKKMRFRKGGSRYQVSPYLLIWNDANYYLAAFDTDGGILKHFRVDKMTGVTMDEALRDKKAHTRISPARYANKNFNMFRGEEMSVSLGCEESMAGVIIDRFGKEVAMRRLSDGSVSVRANIDVSNQFFGWITGFGGKVWIRSPKEISDQYRAYLQSILEQMK